jgi:PD-(D/E)XK nuclease superfamily
MIGLKKKTTGLVFSLDNSTCLAVKTSLEQGLTQSEIMLRSTCPRKWFYRYVLQVERKGYIDPNLIYGSLMHFWLEWLYKNGLQATTEEENPSSVPPVDLSEHILDIRVREEVELAVQKAWIAFKAYRWHYKALDSHLHVIANEQTYEVEFRGFKLTGKVDMIARPNIRDGVFIWDFKTTGQLNATLLDAWSFRFQFLYYCWLYWRATGKKPDGTLVNGLVKTLLRPKKTKSGKVESREGYLNRVAYDMQARRERYFYRQRMPLAKGQLEWFEKEMLIPNLTPFWQMARWLPKQRMGDLASVVLAMNTNQCHMYNSICEYLPLCKDGKLQLGEYFGRDVKHPELAAGTLDGEAEANEEN